MNYTFETSRPALARIAAASRSRSTLVLWTALATASALAFGACTSSSTNSDKVVNRPLVINVGGGGNGPQSLDPAVDYDNDGFGLLPLVYNTLVRAEGSKTVTIVPDLATSWSESTDGLSWTFHLRPNVKFHDGTNVDSAAVKYSFNRLLSMKQGGWADFTAIKSIAAPDPLTVVFHLNYSFYPFLQALSSTYGAEIVSPTTLTRHQVKGDLGAKWLYDHDAGSGPYELARWTHGESVELKKFPEYWRGWTGRHVSDVVFTYGTVSSTVRLGLQGGSVDAAQGLSPQDFKALASGNSGVTVQNFTGGSVFRYISLNTKLGVLKNGLVRLALAKSLDTEAVAKYIFDGFGTSMDSYAPARIPGHVASPAPYGYDLNQAKELLAQGGFANGFTLPAYYFTGDTQGELTLEFWREALAKLKVNLEIKAMPFSEFAAVVNNPQSAPAIFINTWAEDYADSTNNVYFLWLHSKSTPLSGNSAYYANPTVDGLLEAARSARTSEAAAALYKQVLAIVYPQALYLPVVNVTQQVALGPNVHGYQFNLNYTQFYFPVYDMWLS